MKRVVRQTAISAVALLLIAGALSTAGCGEDTVSTTAQTPPTTASTPTSAPSTTGAPAPTVTSITPTTAPGTPSTVPSLPAGEGLTAEQVRNAEITVEFEEDLLTFTLVDGVYQGGPNGDGASVVAATMVGDVAFGDLDGDEVKDAALAVTVGRSGGAASAAAASAYVVALLSQGGEPAQAGFHPVGVGARVDALGIAGGGIFVEAVVPGQEDPGGEPTVPVTATLRPPLNSDGTWLLLHTSQTSETPSGEVREITITSPEPGRGVALTAVIEGTVTIAPFENNLVYTLYDAEMIERAGGPVMVDAPDLGAPGTFELVLDLASLDCGTGTIFVTISDLSAADGSILAMDSVELINYGGG